MNLLSAKDTGTLRSPKPRVCCWQREQRKKKETEDEQQYQQSMQPFKYEYSVYMQYLEKCKII